jgi:hypothetical protein
LNDGHFDVRHNRPASIYRRTLHCEWPLPANCLGFKQPARFRETAKLAFSLCRTSDLNSPAQ